RRHVGPRLVDGRPRGAGVPADPGGDGLRPHADRRPQPPRPGPSGGPRAVLGFLGDPPPQRDVPQGTAGVLRRRGPVRHPVSPRPLDRRDGGRLRFWGAALPADRRAAEGASRARERPLPGLPGPAGGQRLRRPGPVVPPAGRAVYGPLVPELSQVSAVAAVPAHDPGARPPAARRVRARAALARPPAARL